MLSLRFTVFALASAACAAAPTTAALIPARVVQDVAAALVSANVLSIIGVTYMGRDRVRAISVHGVVMGIASIGGQVVGGALIGADLLGLGWRWVFLINVPIGAAALALAPSLISEPRADRRSRIDTAGAALLTLALAALVFPLIQGRQKPDRVFAAVGGEMAVVAVDHGQAHAHVAGELEGGDAGTEREGSPRS